MPRRIGVLPGGSSVARAGLAVGRGDLADAAGLEAGASFLDQLLEKG